MANPQTKSYDGNISGNVLVLVNTGSGKATLIQEIGLVKILCLENSRESTGFRKSSSPSKGKPK